MDSDNSSAERNQPPDTKAFSPVLAARRVLRLGSVGSLATLNKNASPFASLVTVATTPQGEPILLISTLAVHTQNLGRDSRASLLLVGPGGEAGDPLAGARLTLAGHVTGGDPDPMLRRRFLARHEEAAGYADFRDFGFRRFEVQSAHLVAGFGRIVDLGRDELLTDCTGAEALLEAEESAIRHMNDDHADSVRLYATELLGLPEGNWRMTGCDPDGCDLRAGALRGRLDFAERITSPAALRRLLADLAKPARSGS
jgi:putative heme iron utilization protein